MKTANTILFVLFTISFSHIIAQSYDFPYKKVVFSKDFEVLDSVVLSNSQGQEFLHEFYYNSSGQVILQIIKQDGLDGLTNKSNYLYSYNLIGKIVSEVYSIWLDTNWVKLDSTSLIYDRSNNLVELKANKFNRISNIWVDISRELYIYDDLDKNIISKTYQYSDGINWHNNSKYLYEYNSNGKRIYETYVKWDGNDWINNKRHSYSYDSLRSTIVEEFYVINNWRNIAKSNLFYNSNTNLDSVLNEAWNNDSWSIKQKFVHSYDNNNNLIVKLSSRWESGKWDNTKRSTYVYNLKSNISSFFYERSVNSSWLPAISDTKIAVEDLLGNKYEFSATEAHFSYKSITDVKKNKNEQLIFSLGQNYPNPFNPSTTINYSIHKRGFVQLKIYNLLGEEVEILVNKKKQIGNYSVKFNASRLPSGIYFYRLQSGGFADTKKLILLQ